MAEMFQETTTNYLSKRNFHLTPNDQIIDLNLMDSFWIEECPGSEFSIFGNDKNNDTWRLMDNIPSIENAREYLKVIYSLIKED